MDVRSIVDRWCMNYFSLITSSQFTHVQLLFTGEEGESNLFAVPQWRNEIHLQLSMFERIPVRLRWFISNSSFDQYPQEFRLQESLRRKQFDEQIKERIRYRA